MAVSRYFPRSGLARGWLVISRAVTAGRAQRFRSSRVLARHYGLARVCVVDNYLSMLDFSGRRLFSGRDRLRCGFAAIDANAGLVLFSRVRAEQVAS